MKKNIVLALVAAMLLAVTGAGCTQNGNMGENGEIKVEAVRFAPANPGPEAYTVTEDGQILGPDGNVLWQLPINPYSEEYCEAEFIERTGHVYAVYRQGGGVMGSDCQIRLTPDEAVELDSNKNIFEYEGVSFGTSTWVPPGPDNLYMKKDGDEDWTNIGDPNLIYGWNYHVKEDGSEGGGAVAQMEYDGSRYLYVIGFEGISMEHSEAVKQHPGVYRVDIKTNETVRISPEDKDVIEFEIKDGEVVY